MTKNEGKSVFFYVVCMWIGIVALLMLVFFA